MTLICYVGIEVSAKTQWYLFGAELVTLLLFAVVALFVSPPWTSRAR